MPRLFLGTYLSGADQTALGQLPQLNPELEAKWNCRIKWSRPEQLHLTWIFFGNVDESKIENLCQSIKDALKTHIAKFSITYENIECWFNGKTPNLISLVPDRINTELLNFAKDLRLNLCDYASPDRRDQAKRDFKPHVTIARLAAKNGKVSAALINKKRLAFSSINGIKNILPLVQRIDSIALIQSTEQDGGHKYTTIQRF